MNVRRSLGAVRRRRFGSFQKLEDRTLLATFSNVHLTNDTGLSSTDRVTYDPTTSGLVSWSSPSFSPAVVEFDHNGDGAAEGSLTASFSPALFTYAPLAVDSSLAQFNGSFSLRYRAVVQGPGGGAGAWQTLTMTLDRVKPQVVAFSPAASQWTGQMLASASVTLSEAVQTPQSWQAYVENNVGLPPGQTLSHPSPSVVTIAFTQTLAAVSHTTTVNALADIAGNQLSPHASATWHVNASPGAQEMDDLLVDEDAADSIVDIFEPFHDPNDPPETLDYDIAGVSNEDLFDSLAIDPVTGELTIDYAADAHGEADITIVATDPHGASAQTTLHVTINPVNDPPQLTLGPPADEGQGVYVVSGFVTDVDDSVSGLTVTFSGVASGSVQTDAGGQFALPLTATEIGYAFGVTQDLHGAPSNTAGVYLD